MNIIQRIRTAWNQHDKEERDRRIKEYMEMLRSKRDGEVSILFGAEYTITDTEQAIDLPFPTQHFLIDNATNTSSDLKVKLNYNAPDSEYVDLPADSGLPLQETPPIYNFRAYCPTAGETSVIKVTGVRI